MIVTNCRVDGKPFEQPDHLRNTICPEHAAEEWAGLPVVALMVCAKERGWMQKVNRKAWELYPQADKIVVWVL
jgi:hypothetical protein